VPSVAPAHYLRRRVLNAAMLGLMGLAMLVAAGLLLAVLGYLVLQGVGGLTPELFVDTPRPVGEPGGGMANAIVGTLVLVALAALVGLPVGIGTGVFLAEYGRSGRLGTLVRFTIDVLTGIPSITLGLFAYSLVVLPMRSFSALAGGAALAVLMLPTVARATEEMLRLVPDSLREAGLALGIPRWKTTLRLILPTALGGIVTGALLAIARAAGETAPLLFTAFGNRSWSWDLARPIAALPLQIFAYAISPYDDWHRQAWAGALVLVGLVLALSVCARLLAARSGASGGPL
jgi:phosphate transport system permease protein